MRTVVIACVSDLHVNSTVALCPPEGTRLDDGGRYTPSVAQRWLWDCWLDYWRRVREAVRRERAELWVIYNGDLWEGTQHHGTTQVISAHPEPQQYVAERIFGVPRALRPAHQFIVRGTEAHVGPSGATEEAWARSLGAEPNPETGRWSWWHLRIAPHGVLIDALHHGRMGTRPWTRVSAVGALAAEIVYEHMERGERPPALAIRSHHHRYADSYDAHPTRVVQLPAWQLRTSYGWRVAPERPPEIGGLVVTVRPGDVRPDVAIHLYRPEATPVWHPCDRSPKRRSSRRSTPPREAAPTRARE